MTSVKRLRIGTHDGIFHADEVLAIWMLRILPEFKESEIIRSRKEQEWKTCDVLVDVGGVYDAASKRFDHHQRDFSNTLSDAHHIRLSSAGLIYKYYGLAVIEEVLNRHVSLDVVKSAVEKFTVDKVQSKSQSSSSSLPRKKNSDSDAPESWEDLAPDTAEQSSQSSPSFPIISNELYQYIYKNFIEGIDGIDNGIKKYSGTGKTNYNISTDLSSRISNLNVNCFAPSSVPMSAQEQTSRFYQAIELAGKEFTESVMYAYHHWYPSKKTVERAFHEALQHGVHNTKSRILQLQSFATWKGHLYELEQKFNLLGHFLFVIFEDVNSKTWRVQGIPQAPNLQQCRLSLPQQWWGLNDKQIQEQFNIYFVSFVHHNGFIGGTYTLEGALQLASMTIQSSMHLLPAHYQ